MKLAPGEAKITRLVPLLGSAEANANGLRGMMHGLSDTTCSADAQRVAKLIAASIWR